MIHEHPRKESGRSARAWGALALLAAGLTLPGPRAWAQPVPPPWERIKFGDFIEALRFSGDFRLRQENFSRRSLGKNDRNRFRFRLRLVTDVQLPQDVKLGLRWGSGTGEQVSTNQSLDNLSGQKAVWIDQAYLSWVPQLSELGGVSLTGGRTPNLFWRPYSADLIWDEDLSPEGFFEGAEWLFSELGIKLFATALQAVTDEDSNTSRNQWLFSQQAGFDAQLPLQTRLKLAAAYHKWADENRSTLSQAALNEGNRRTAAGVLVNKFGTGELSGELSSWLGSLPVSLQATLARNFRARGDLAGPAARDGYQYGLILGKAAAAASWELAWFLKYAQTDVTVADVADSDFGDGGTNRRGHVFWAAYNPQEWLQLKAKYSTTKVIDTQFAPGANDVNRFQGDVVVKF